MASPEAADESRELLTPEMDGPISLGTCALCQDTVNDITASGHLIECIAQQNLPASSGTDPSGYDQSLHLSVHDGSGLYWMELAVRADTTLRQLDGFLRGMWLECCGHLSEFTILGVRYTNLAPHRDDPNAAAIRADYWMEDDEEHMDVAVADVIPTNALVSYEYDYGSTTELFLENLGRHGDLVGFCARVSRGTGTGSWCWPATSPTRSAWPAGNRRAGGYWRRTPMCASPYPSATSAVRRPDTTSR